MDKKYETKDPARQIERLREEENLAILRKYEVYLEQAEVCNLAEFLITEHPERYAKSMGTENNYRGDKDLQRIYVIADKQKNKAVMINVNENGKLPKGEFGVYDLQHHKFELTNEEIKQKIRASVEKTANGTLTAKEEEEMVEEISPHTLEDIDKLVTIDKEIENRTRKVVDKKIDEKNKENGISEEQRDAIEKGKKEESVTIGQEQEGQTGKQKIPQDVEKACRKIGVSQIRGFFYVNSAELSNKVDGTRVNKNGNQSLIIEVYDNRLGCNKYYGFQDDRMVLYGNDSEENQAIKDVTGNVTQMGKVVKPLKPKETQFIEYEDSQGLVIREEIDDKSDLSMQEINRYREEMEVTLTKYSQEIYKIKNDPVLSNEQKIERIQAVDDWCDKKTTELARENDISMNDDKNIDAATDEHTAEIQEEIGE